MIRQAALAYIPRSLLGPVLAATLLMAAGCGGDSGSTASTTTGSSTSTTETSAGRGAQLHNTRGQILPTTVALSSPAFADGKAIPIRYTCDGDNSSPALRWSNIPPGTAELALFQLAGRVNRQKVEITGVNWGVAGLNTTSKGLSAGKLPPGAISGHSPGAGKGFSVCPAEGSTATYVMVLYALRRRLVAKPGFDPRRLRQRAADTALAGGVLSFSYRRARFEASGSLSQKPVPVRYTCDGANVSPQVRWRNVPAHTAELAIFLLDNKKPTHGRHTFDWAVTGLKPHLHGVEAGALPPGAVVGRRSDGHTGYSICPAKGASQEYILVVYALTHHLKASPGFDPNVMLSRAIKALGRVTLSLTTYKRS